MHSAMTNADSCMCQHLARVILVSIIGIAIFLPSRTSTATTQVKAEDLRLIPFPKQVKISSGQFELVRQMKIMVNEGPMALQSAMDLKQELARTTGFARDTFILQPKRENINWSLVLSEDRADDAEFESALGTLPSQSESYKLVVKPRFAAVGARTEAGLVHGIQTLRQLARANVQGHSLPCLSIEDFPSLQLRGFQDDITRGPNPTLKTLESEIRMASLLKMNFFTYYLEHQYEFKKHPVIGPKDGSLKPKEVKALVKYAEPYQVEIIGGQQSFGHFYHILKHQEYANLRETEHILDPTNEESYKLLDDLYSEQAPLMESKLFNVSCDETHGLGTGPSKSLANQIGVGGVYARHMKRIHDILKDKYGKRMMMWGDIILRHPENLNEIPKDTIMLSWGYHAAESFEKAIVPFAQSGYDFFVCPGVSCWGRMLPDFNTAVINIHNYVRDGAKYGAMGMLNTTWDDTGENLFNYNWHGIAWGAECAWNASVTPIEDFNRRIGGVLFGEKGDHFGQAITLLSKTHALPGYGGMHDGRFWQGAFGELPANKKTALDEANALLEIINPALAHLQAAKKNAKVNGDLLDFFIFGADRMKLMATRRLDFFAAAEAYEQAGKAVAKGEKAEPSIQNALQVLTTVRDEHAASKERYRELWLRENRPYALDWTLNKFDKYIAEYDKRIAKLQEALAAAREKRPLPSTNEIGLQIVEK